MSAINTWGVQPNVWSSESGSINITMDDFTLSASGTLDQPVTGALSVTMDDFTLATPSFSGGGGFVSPIGANPINAKPIKAAGK